MKLLRHRVCDFRNIENAELEFSGGVTVISGKNGQGKTNLLESLWMLTGGRSFRGGKDAALIRKGAEFAVAESAFFSQGRSQTARLTVTPQERKLAFNGGAALKASAQTGNVTCVAFSPDQLTLVKGAPEGRRKFIDSALCQLYPAYVSQLKTYTRLVFQKNSLLKDCYSVSAAFDMLDVFDESIAKAAVGVTAARAGFAKQLLPLAQRIYSELSENREEFFFEYRSTLFDEEPDEEQARTVLSDSRKDDVRAGFCTRGPHRDDLSVRLDGEEMKGFASQGQQRSAVLALELAQTELFHSITGERPILLLDDVLSELDDSRQDYLISAIGDGQAVITGCDSRAVASRTDCLIYTIDNGAIA